MIEYFYINIFGIFYVLERKWEYVQLEYWNRALRLELISSFAYHNRKKSEITVYK